MKGKWFYLVVFVVVFLVSLIAHIPANWVYGQLPLNRQVQLQGISGTIWQGRAEQIVVEKQRLGQVSWDFDGWRLLMGKAQYQFRLGRNSDIKLNAKGEVGVTFSGPYASNIFASIPVEHVLQQLNLQVPIDVSGQLELSLAQYDYAAPWCQHAQGNVVWSAGQIDSPLGSLEPGPVIADLSCQQQDIKLDGKQNSDQVSSAFNVSLDEKSQYHLDAWFKPGAKFPPSLANQLKWLGQPDSQGRYPFNFSGRFKL